MECVKCGSGMKDAEILGAGQPVFVQLKKKSIFDSAKLCVVECCVCPQCGHIELKAAKPELFQNV